MAMLSSSLLLTYSPVLRFGTSTPLRRLGWGGRVTFRGLAGDTLNRRNINEPVGTDDRELRPETLLVKSPRIVVCCFVSLHVYDGDQEHRPSPTGSEVRSVAGLPPHRYAANRTTQRSPRACPCWHPMAGLLDMTGSRSLRTSAQELGFCVRQAPVVPQPQP